MNDIVIKHHNYCSDTSSFVLMVKARVVPHILDFMCKAWNTFELFEHLRKKLHLPHSKRTSGDLNSGHLRSELTGIYHGFFLSQYLRFPEGLSVNVIAKMKWS